VVLRIPLRVPCHFGYRAVTFFGRRFHAVHLQPGLVTLLTRSYNPPVLPPAHSARVGRSGEPRFGLFRFRSPLLTESRLLSLPPGTEMVHFPGLARARLCVQRAVTEFYSAGFPHSDIPGSKPACGSPRLFAAGHVLLRLLAPRHPPYALSSLTTKLTQPLSTAAAAVFDFRQSKPCPPPPRPAPKRKIRASLRAVLPTPHSLLAQQAESWANLRLAIPNRSGSLCARFSCQRTYVNILDADVSARPRGRSENKKPGAKRRAVCVARPTQLVAWDPTLRCILPGYETNVSLSSAHSLRVRIYTTPAPRFLASPFLPFPSTTSPQRSPRRLPVGEGPCAPALGPLPVFLVACH
jgi:hypothetical protein